MITLWTMFFSAQLPPERINRSREAMLNDKADAIRLYFETLFSAWGFQHWWPAQSRFEMIVGAYLTQNTAWTNVEKALSNLRRERLLTIDGIRRASTRQLEALIRPSGYFRQKAQRLKTFVSFLDKHYGGSLSRMFARPTTELRNELLTLNGVGPETADSILLYAGNHPVFVVDAYTRRILERHDIVTPKASYEEIRELCEQALTENALINTLTAGTNLAFASATPVPRVGTCGRPLGTCHHPSRVSRAERSQIVQILNDMHGLIVGVGKNYCLKSQPRCEQCPLQKYLPRPK
jgi:endonuclease-3 related protein